MAVVCRRGSAAPSSTVLPGWALSTKAPFRSRRETSSDAAFTLVEVLVALSLIGTVMVSSTVYLVRTMSVTRQQGDMQVAVQLATDAMERVRSVPARFLLAGRTTAMVTAQMQTVVSTSAVGQALADTVLAIDPTTAVNALPVVPAVLPVAVPAVLPTVPQTTILHGLAYTQQWYIGRCWMRRTGGDCGKGNEAVPTSIALLRVVVAVSWASKECTGGTCMFTTSTLVDEALTTPILSPPAVPPPTVSVSPAVPMPSVTTVPPASVTPSPSPAPPTTPPPVSVPPTPALTPTIPLTFAMVWANSTTADDRALWVGGTRVNIRGGMHSNSGVTFVGADVVVGARVEYGTTFTSFSGITSPTPRGVKVSPSTPRFRNVPDYRPGGPAAAAAGSGYRQMPCVNGSWTYSAAAVGNATVVYVPCAMKIGDYTAAIKPLVVAEGSISILGGSVTIGDPANLGAGGLISNSSDSPAIHLAATDNNLYATIEAMNGLVRAVGLTLNTFCPIIADTVELLAGDNTLTASSACAPTL